MDVKKIFFISVIGMASASVHGYDESDEINKKLNAELAWIQAESIVFSAIKREQKEQEVAASVFILSQEDIRRSGVTSVPEALRMVPGVHVARINTRQWAIAIHGFNSRFSDKLLVLVDGRSIYSPHFNGIYWDAQDIMLESIERIEVIRGSSSALWGNNAMNGVINIITKNAGNTQGLYTSGGYGSEEKGFGSIRYGGTLGDNSQYRVYSKYFNRDDGGTRNHKSPHDGGELISGGFRLDTQLDDQHKLMINGDIYDGTSGQAADVPDITQPNPYVRAIRDENQLAGKHLLMRWTENENGHQNWLVQSYFEHIERDDSILGEQETIVVDASVQQGLRWHSQEISWGLEYKYIDNSLKAGSLITYIPAKRQTDLYSGFISDEIGLFDDQVKLTLASRFEHNDFTGFEWQPTARLTWLVNNQHTLWTAFSRSVRVPSLTDHDQYLEPQILPENPPSSPLPVVLQISGSDKMRSEEVLAYELGYRMQLSTDLKLDLSAYYNNYNNVRSFELDKITLNPGPPARLDADFHYDNKLEASVYGFDSAADWRVNSGWRIAAGYSYARTHIHEKNSSTDTITLPRNVYIMSPQHMLTLRSSWTVANDWDVDVWTRYVDRLDHTDVNAYVNLDARLAWRPVKGLELSVVGQNLLDKKQVQYTNDGVTDTHNSQAERSVYIKFAYSL